MKKIIFPLGVFIIMLIGAKLLFGVDIAGLCEGFLSFLGDIFATQR